MNEIATLDKITTEIVLLKNQTAQNIIEIGKRLIQAKEQLPHGEWGKWLESEVEFTDRTARRFMQVAKECSNWSTMSDLTQSKVFALLDLPQEQREEFIATTPVDEMTTRQLQQAIKEKKDLERLLESERSKPSKVVEKIVERKPADYDSLKSKITENQNTINRLQQQKKLLEEKNDLIESEVEQFNNLKAQIEKLTKTKQETLEQINTITELSGLVVEIENFLKTKLAPVKYSKTLSILSNKTALTNLLDILSAVDGWSKEMRSLIPNNDFVEVLYESID